MVVIDEIFQQLGRAREAKLRSSVAVEPLTRHEPEILELVRAGLRNAALPRVVWGDDAVQAVDRGHCFDNNLTTTPEDIRGYGGTLRTIR